MVTVHAAFLGCVRTSLPYAWDLIAGLIKDLEAGDSEFADNQVPTTRYRRRNVIDGPSTASTYAVELCWQVAPSARLVRVPGRRAGA
jgi:hypothetical protein